MRSILLFLVIVGFTVNVLSQNLKPFPTSADKPLWVMITTYPHLPGNEDTFCQYYTLLGDTVINSKTYSKIHRIEDTVITYNDGNIYIGAIRQDQDTVFFVDDFALEERIAMDYSVGINDTILDLYWGSYLILSDVDTLILNNEIYRRYYTSCFDKWIEGIGNAEWFAFELCYLYPEDGSYTRLHSFKLGDTIIYGENCKCEITVGINKRLDVKQSFKIYPNPTRDYINIINIEKGTYSSQNIQIEITDLSGKSYLLQNIQLIDYYKRIDLPDIKPGIYLLHISSENNSVFCKLLIN